MITFRGTYSFRHEIRFQLMEKCRLKKSSIMGFIIYKLFAFRIGKFTRSVAVRAVAIQNAQDSVVTYFY